MAVAEGFRVRGSGFSQGPAGRRGSSLPGDGRLTAAVQTESVRSRETLGVPSAGISFATAGAGGQRVIHVGWIVFIAGMLAGCDSIGGGGDPWFPTDIGEQVIVFVQDFARQVLAAWLF